MKTSTPAFATSVDSPDQTVVYNVSIALPGGLQIDASKTSVSKIEIDGSTVTDQAGSTRLEQGYTAYEATIGISGRVDPNDEFKTAAWFFARYPFPAQSDGTLSPIAYQSLHSCLVAIEFGPTDSDRVEVFVGYPDSYTQTSDGDVEITCIDFRQKLRGVVELPPVVTAPPYNAGLTSEFAVDAILRKATQAAISSWPAQRAQCALAVGMRSSIWPEVGTLDDSGTQPIPTFRAGAWGTGLAAVTRATLSSGFTTLRYLPATPLGDSITVEALVTKLTSNGVTIIAGTSPGGRRVEINISRLGVTATVADTTSTDSYFFSRPLDDANPHIVRVRVTWAVTSTDWSAALRVDSGAGSSDGSGPRTAPSVRTGPWTSVFVDPGPGSSVLAGLQVTNEGGTPANQPFTPQAVLDPSLNPLQVIPAVSGDPWQVIQQIAAAEQAVAGFFGGRVFKFKNRNTITSAPIARTITSKGALEQIGVSSELAAVINRAQVGYTGWTFAAARTTLYQADTVLQVPRRTKTTIIASLDGYAVDIDTSVAILPDGTTDATQSWVRFSTTPDGVSKHPGVKVTLTPIAPDKVSILLDNTASNYDAYAVSSADFTDLPPSTPVFRIAGRVVAPVDEVTVDYQWPTPELGGAASSQYGEILVENKGNPWIQFADSATAMCKALVLDNYEPRAEFTEIAVGPDPRIEPADGLHLVDSDRTGVDDYVRVFGFKLQLEANDGGVLKYAMQLDARAFGTPGCWLLGVDGRSELGVTTYLR